MNTEKLARFERENRIAARVILLDVCRYGGEGAALVRWARMVLAKRESKAAA